MNAKPSLVRAKAAQRFQRCIDLCGRGVAADSSRIRLCADARCARVDHHRICVVLGLGFAVALL